LFIVPPFLDYVTALESSCAIAAFALTILIGGIDDSDSTLMHGMWGCVGSGQANLCFHFNQCVKEPKNALRNKVPLSCSLPVKGFLENNTVVGKLGVGKASVFSNEFPRDGNTAALG